VINARNDFATTASLCKRKKKKRKKKRKIAINLKQLLIAILFALGVVIFVRFSAQSSCFRAKRSLLKEDFLKGEVDVVSL